MFLLILNSLSAFASTSYIELGNKKDFALGSGVFDADITPITFTRSINFPLWSPLIADLDNDSINEIIVIDGNTLKLFQNKTLEILDTFNLGFTNPNRSSNPLIFDIDGDGTLEFIIAEQGSDMLQIINYNGTSISGINIPILMTVADGETLISCESSNSCLMVVSEHSMIDTGTFNKLSVQAFNSTNFTGDILTLSIGGPSNFRNFCFSSIRTLPFADIDNDGVNEFVLSYLSVPQVSVPFDINMRVLSINESNSVVLEIGYTADDFGIFRFDTFDSGASCESTHAGTFFTSPYLDDIDGGSSNGIETVIGIMLTIDTYKMISYNSDGSFLDDYPEVTQADGVIISNIFKANAFTNTGLVDFCIAGFKDTTNILDVTCASEQTSSIPETREYPLSTVLLYNISNIYGQKHMLAHSGEHDGTNSVTEVLLSYGVFELDNSGCFLGNCDLNLLWENPKGSSTLISVDLENVGQDDILALTSTNLWYFDDEFTNSPAEIDSYFINPCIDQTWKQNTSVEVRITPTDINSDLVRARSILYFGEDNLTVQDSGFSSFQTSGTTFSFSFIGNVTKTNANLRLIVTDFVNNNTNVTQDVSFSVGTEGVVKGDCTTDVDLITVTENITIVDVADEENNTIDTGITNLKNDIGLVGIGNATIWLLLMLLVAYGIWTGGSTQKNLDHPIILFGIVCMAEFFMLLLGLKLGYIGFGTIFSVLIIAIAIITVAMRRQVVGGG